MENISEKEQEFLQKTRNKQARLQKNIVISWVIKLCVLELIITVIIVFKFHIISISGLGFMDILVFIGLLFFFFMFLTILWKPKDSNVSFKMTPSKELIRDILIADKIEIRYNQFIQWQEEEKQKAIELQEMENRKSKDYWATLDGSQFEKEVAKVFQKCGFLVKHVGGPGDGGIDILMEYKSIQYIVQCKNHKKRIPPNVVVELHDALNFNSAHRAILVSFSGVTSGVWSYILGKPIDIVNIDHLLLMNSTKTYCSSR